MSEEKLAKELKLIEASVKYEKFLIGKEIKKLRAKAHMKQAELAALIRTSQSAIARIENGRQNLTLDILVRIGAALEKKVQINFSNIRQ